MHACVIFVESAPRDGTLHTFRAEFEMPCAPFLGMTVSVNDSYLIKVKSIGFAVDDSGWWWHLEAEGIKRDTREEDVAYWVDECGFEHIDDIEADDEEERCPWEDARLGQPPITRVCQAAGQNSAGLFGLH